MLRATIGSVQDDPFGRLLNYTADLLETNSFFGSTIQLNAVKKLMH